MLATPALIAAARPVAEGIVSRLSLPGAPSLPTEGADRAEALSDHAIIVGYGLSGRHLQRVLAAAEVPHIVLEQNLKLVREARAEGVPILFGDGTRREVLEQVDRRIEAADDPHRALPFDPRARNAGDLNHQAPRSASR